MSTLSRWYESTTLSLSSLLLLSAPRLAFAQNDLGGLPNTPGPDNVDARAAIINVLQFVLSFMALIAVIFIVVAGIRLIVSQGEEEQKEKAKKTIIYVIVGLIVILLAKVIVTFATTTFISGVQNGA